jgi:AraC-like DNA-binding protein
LQLAQKLLNLGVNKTVEVLEKEIVAFFKKESDVTKKDFLENALGRFKINNIYDSKEFIIKEYSCTYFRDYDLKFKTEASNFIQIAFFLNDKVLKDRINNQINEYLPYHNYIYYTEEDADVDIYFKKDVEYRNLDIYVAEDYFHHLVNTSNEFVKKFILLINQKKSCSLFENGIPVNSQMMSALAEIKRYPKKGIAKDYYVKSRIMTLLQLIFEEEENRKSIIGDKKHQTVKEQEIEKIHDIKDFINKNLHEFYTIENLSTLFEINDFKIKKGFKELFNMGVFEYSTKMRMKYAQNILKTTKLSIKEIAYKIGYGSPSSFSAAFKKECFVSPNVYREKRNLASTDIVTAPV